MLSRSQTAAFGHRPPHPPSSPEARDGAGGLPPLQTLGPAPPHSYRSALAAPPGRYGVAPAGARPPPKTARPMVPASVPNQKLRVRRSKVMLRTTMPPLPLMGTGVP